MKTPTLLATLGLLGTLALARPQQGSAATTTSPLPIPTDIMFLARVVAPDAPSLHGKLLGQYHPSWDSSIADLWQSLNDSSDVIDWDYLFVDVDGDGVPTLVWNRVGSRYAGTLYRDGENDPLVVMNPANASDEDEERRVKGLYTDGYGLISKLGDDDFTFTGELSRRVPRLTHRSWLTCEFLNFSVL